MKANTLITTSFSRLNPSQTLNKVDQRIPGTRRLIEEEEEGQETEDSTYGEMQLTRTPLSIHSVPRV